MSESSGGPSDPPPAGGDVPVRPSPPPSPSERLAALGDVLGVDLTPARLIAGLLVVVGIVAAGYVLLRPAPAPSPEVSLPFADPGAAAGSSSSTTAASTVFVHAAGAVNRPGLYQIPADARLADVIDVAGGPAPDADLNRVNLAAPVEDGQQVYVPRVGEPAPAIAAGGGPAGGASTGPVNLNTAGPAELEALPGVGPAIAQAIVTHRDEHGDFRSIDDLLEVPGIGEAKLAQLRELVTV